MKKVKMASKQARKENFYSSMSIPPKKTKTLRKCGRSNLPLLTQNKMGVIFLPNGEAVKRKTSRRLFNVYKKEIMLI